MTLKAWHTFLIAIPFFFYSMVRQVGDMSDRTYSQAQYSYFIVGAIFSGILFGITALIRRLRKKR